MAVLVVNIIKGIVAKVVIRTMVVEEDVVVEEAVVLLTWNS